MELMHRRKGQVFSVDFLIAVSMLTLALAIALQTSDLMQKRGNEFANSQDSLSEAIAQHMVSASAGFSVPDGTDYCCSYSNGAPCALAPVPPACGASFSCPTGKQNLFMAKRLVNCAGSVCSLDVGVCA